MNFVEKCLEYNVPAAFAESVSKAAIRKNIDPEAFDLLLEEAERTRKTWPNCALKLAELVKRYKQPKNQILDAPTSIQAIPTTYNGVKFRSRLEARWAVFFDRIYVDYCFEYEGFQLPSGWYVPDFWLPELSTFVEVKPFGINNPQYMEKCCQKCRELAELTGLKTWMVFDLNRTSTHICFYPDGTIDSFKWEPIFEPDLEYARNYSLWNPK